MNERPGKEQETEEHVQLHSVSRLSTQRIMQGVPRYSSVFTGPASIWSPGTEVRLVKVTTPGGGWGWRESSGESHECLSTPSHANLGAISHRLFAENH